MVLGGLWRGWEEQQWCAKVVLMDASEEEGAWRCLEGEMEEEMPSHKSSRVLFIVKMKGKIGIWPSKP